MEILYQIQDINVVLDENDRVIQINDNTIEMPETVNMNNFNSAEEYKVSNLDKEYYLNKAKEKLNNSNILEETLTFYYDIEKNKKYVFVEIKIEDLVLGAKIESFIFDI